MVASSAASQQPHDAWTLHRVRARDCKLESWGLRKVRRLQIEELEVSGFRTGNACSCFVNNAKGGVLRGGFLK